jgi:hypothetical protein
MPWQDPLIDGPVKRGDQLRTPCYRPNAAVSRWTTPARAALDARYQMSMLTQRVRRWLTWRVEGAEDFPGASDVERAGLEPATNETSPSSALGTLALVGFVFGLAGKLRVEPGRGAPEAPRRVRSYLVCAAG